MRSASLPALLGGAAMTAEEALAILQGCVGRDQVACPQDARGWEAIRALRALSADATLGRDLRALVAHEDTDYAAIERMLDGNARVSVVRLNERESFTCYSPTLDAAVAAARARAEEA